MVRISRSTAGTVEQREIPVTCGESLKIALNFSANSSAVSRASVFIRQDDVNFSPSNNPRTVLVFPTSIANNMILLI